MKDGSKLYYSSRYLSFCRDHDGSGEGEHHVILRADGGGDGDNIVHLSVEDHKRAHEILYEENVENRLAQQAYSVTRGLGHPLDEVARDKIRQAHLGRTYDMPDYQRDHIAASLRGRSLSEEHKRATSDGVKELWKDPEYREKQSKSRKVGYTTIDVNPVVKSLHLLQWRLNIVLNAEVNNHECFRYNK